MNSTGTKEKQAKTYYRVGNDFLRSHNYVKAISSYQQAIRFAPDYFKAYCNLGVALKNAGMLKEAEKVFGQALSLKPRSAVILNNLGNVFTAMQRFNEAITFYKWAIRYYPTYQAAYYNLGQVLYFTGKEKEATETRIILEKLKISRSRKSVVSQRIKRVIH